MPAVEDDALLLGRRRAEQPEQRLLRGLHWEGEVVATVQHEERERDARREVDRVVLREARPHRQPARPEDCRLESPIDREHDRRDGGAHADAEVRQPIAGDVRPCSQVVDRSTDVLHLLNHEVAQRTWPGQWRLQPTLVRALVHREQKGAPRLHEKAQVRHLGLLERVEDEPAGMREVDDRLIGRPHVPGKEQVRRDALPAVRGGVRHALDAPAVRRLVDVFHHRLQIACVVGIQPGRAPRTPRR